MKDKEPKRICDNCSNLHQNNNQTVEFCWAYLEGSKFISDMPKDYINERLEGNKNNCKRFKKI